MAETNEATAWSLEGILRLVPEGPLRHRLVSAFLAGEKMPGPQEEPSLSWGASYAGGSPEMEAETEEEGTQEEPWESVGPRPEAGLSTRTTDQVSV